MLAARRALLPGHGSKHEAAEGQLLGSGRLLVVVIAHDKPDELTTCLEALLAQEDRDSVSLAVSLDGPMHFGNMDAVVNRFAATVPIAIWHKPGGSNYAKASVAGQSVSKISEHFHFALGEAFDKRGFNYAVFLETDLKVAPDFFWYFRSTAWLLDKDPTLFCVSAWNDNGFKELVSDSKRLFRTDYFPGLGWMIRSDTWRQIKDHWPKWPSTGWDHWFRRGAGLRPRECIAPEMPRTFHFDEKGTNVKKSSALAKMLRRMAESELKPGNLGDLSYLLADN
jgi:alpha-1,3-mannosyl-glycoprotein beta-1,2-N-acetylglucosaminyltransferase